MDKILEGLVCSIHPVNLKTAIVKKVVEAAEREVTEEQCQALFTLTARFILLGEDAFRKMVGAQVLEAYARCHRPQFGRFFTKDFVLDLLQQGYGGRLDRKDPAIVDYVHCGLHLLAGCPSAPEILGVVRVEVLRMVCERPEPALCAHLSAMLSDFTQCIPEDKSAILFCQQLVRTIGCFSCPAGQEEELREYVGQVTAVSTLLQDIWKAETATLLPSLQEVFAIISSTDTDFDPSIALASLVQHIPLQMITVLIDRLTSDRRVKDASFTQALCRMIDWLSWPLAQHVDTWIIALLKALAAVPKFKILIDVTLFKLELVFDRLSYPIVRQGALVVLSHMLLSFQHSPEAFHLVIPHVIPLVQALRTDGLPTSQAFLLQFTELVHCMMYQYSGFPELYDHILETIKDLPKPSEEKIKLVLNKRAWAPQSNSLVPGLLRLSGRSETGKTGLVNLGNTCYMNSIIQILFMATDFRTRVLSLHLNGANILMKKLQLLFAFLAHTQRAAYAPRNFVEASRPPWFNAGSQQDCSEYLRFLLDRLHEEEKTLQILESPGPEVVSCSNTTSKDPGTHLNLVELETKPVADRRTLIETMFRGRLSTGIRCMQCNSVSEKNEPFTDLSLAFCPSAPTTAQGGPQTEEQSEESKGLCHGAINCGSKAPEQDPAAKSPADRVIFAPVTNKLPLSVPDMLNYFLAPEILDAENAYFCERCGSLQRAEKAMRLVAAPEYLILTLLRFSYDAKSNVRRKILDNVTIPPMLRLPVHTPPPLPRTSSSSTSSSPPPLQVDSPESSENLAKKFIPTEKVEEGENSTEERADRAELMSRGGGRVMVHSVPYVLSSVVMHSGMSSESGHYYSYGRNINGADGAQHPGDHFALDEEEESGNGQGDVSTCSAPSVTSKQTGEAVCANRGAQEARDWLLFNDSRVTFTNFQLVQNVTDRFPKDTAYVLLYRKQGATAQSANRGGPANRVTLSSSEPPLQKELLDAITKDNKLYLQWSPKTHIGI